MLALLPSTPGMFTTETLDLNFNHQSLEMSLYCQSRLMPRLRPRVSLFLGFLLPRPNIQRHTLKFLLVHLLKDLSTRAIILGTSPATRQPTSLNFPMLIGGLWRLRSHRSYLTFLATELQQVQLSTVSLDCLPSCASRSGRWP